MAKVEVRAGEERCLGPGHPSREAGGHVGQPPPGLGVGAPGALRDLRARPWGWGMQAWKFRKIPKPFCSFLEVLRPGLLGSGHSRGIPRR